MGNKKAFPSRTSESEGRQLPGTLSVEELGLSFPGRLPGSRVVAASSAFPFRPETEQWPASLPREERLADYSGGTAADSNGLSY